MYPRVPSLKKSKPGSAKREPYVRTLRLSLVGGQQFPSKDAVTGSSDPYCVISVTGCEHTVRTPVVERSLEPVWNAQAEFQLSKESSYLVFTGKSMAIAYNIVLLVLPFEYMA